MKKTLKTLFLMLPLLIKSQSVKIDSAYFEFLDSKNKTISGFDLNNSTFQNIKINFGPFSKPVKQVKINSLEFSIDSTLNFIGDYDVKKKTCKINKSSHSLEDINNIELITIVFIDKKSKTIRKKDSETNNATDNPQKDKESENGVFINFLPKDDQIFTGINPDADCACHTGSLSVTAENELVLNNATKELFLFKRRISIGDNKYVKKRINKRKIRPLVGRSTNICITNTNPYSDSITLTTIYYNRNTEQGEAFQKLYDSATGTKKTEDKTEESPANAQSSDTITIIFEKLNNLNNQLKEFYAAQKAEPYISTQYLANAIAIIKENIKNAFNVQSINGLKEIKSNYSNISSDEKKELEKLIDDAIYYFNKLNTLHQFAFYPIQTPNVDEVEYKFDFYKNGVNTGSKSYNYFTKGGFKIDFSGGFFGHGLIDHKYITKTEEKIDTSFYYNPFFIKTDSILGIDTSSKNIIIRDNNGNFSIGAGLLAHFYTRTGWRFNPTFTAGFIIDNNVQTRYLLGTSLIFGQEQRLVFSGGVCLGKAKRLASGLEEGQAYTFSSGQTNDIPTRDEWGTSWFFGLSWNFGGVSPSFNKSHKENK